MLLINADFDILAYRNAIYQGPTHQLRRSGNGILLFDSDQIVMAGFQGNLMQGPYLYFSKNYIFYGHCQGGFLSGQNVLVDQKNLKVVKGTFLRGRLTGQYKLVDIKAKREEVYINKQKGKFLLSAARLDGDIQLSQFSRLMQFANQVCDRDPALQIIKMTNGIFIGYGKRSSMNQRALGLIEMGVYYQGQLNGIGCRQSQKQYELGLFKSGTLITGHKQSSKNQKSLMKKQQLKQMKKEWFLKQCNFNNQVVFSSSTLIVDTKMNQMSFIFKTKSQLEISSAVSPNKLLKGVLQSVDNNKQLVQLKEAKGEGSPIRRSQRNKTPDSYKRLRKSQLLN